MSLNQSRAEKSETHLRKGGRFGNSGNQRGFSAGSGRGGGAGSAPPPSSSLSSLSSSSNSINQQPVLPNKSVKKPGGGHGGHSKANPAGTSSEVSSQIRGFSHGASSGLASNALKPPDSGSLAGSRSHSRPPHPQPLAGDSDSSSLRTPTKGDSSKGFQLQFGTISPGFVNGMQIPARTSSAPPNLDEQKHDQVPPLDIPSLSKMQQQSQPKKDTISSSHPAAGDSHPHAHTTRDVPLHPSGSSLAPQKSPVVPFHGISVPVGYQQSQIPIQFGGPNPQIQSQGVTGSSLPMPVSLSMGNAPQQIYVQGFPQHSYPQGMHQGVGFPPQITNQLASQIGNLRMAMPQQYTPQQDGKFMGVRKNPVKITHPDTHEELRLDKRTDSYVDQSQRVQQSNVSPYGSGLNYYQTLPPGSYNHAFYMQTPSSVPLSSSQLTSGGQGNRYNVPYLNPQAMNNIPVSIARSQPLPSSESINLERSHDAPALSVPLPSASVQVTVKAPGASALICSKLPEKEKPRLQKPAGEVVSVHNQTGKTVGSSETHISRSTADVKLLERESQTSVEIQTVKTHASTIAPVAGSYSDAPTLDARKRDSFKRHDSFKDHQRKTNKKDIQQSQQQQQMNASDSTILKTPKVEGLPIETSITFLVKHPEDISSGERADETSMITSNLSSHAEEKSASGADTLSGIKHKDTSDSQNPSLIIAENQALDDTSVTFPNAPEEAATGDVDAELLPYNHRPEPRNKIEPLLVSDASSEDKISAEKNLDLTVDPSESVAQAEDLVKRGAVDDGITALVPPSESMPKEEVQIEVEDLKRMNILADELSTSCQVDDSVAKVSRPEPVGSDEAPSSQLLDAEVGSTEGSSLEMTVTNSETSSISDKGADATSGSITISAASTDSKEKETKELMRPKSVPAKKKKMKELLSRADAAGTNSDLYMAYKGPEEKKETDASPTLFETIAAVESKDVGPVDSLKVDSLGKKNEKAKPEPDDWEDVVDISGPNLNPSVGGGIGGGLGRKYSRDFLLTFREQCVDLPAGFEIGTDISDVVVMTPGGSPLPSPGRIIDRPPISVRDRRPSGNLEEDKWTRGGTARVEVGNLRPGQVGHGVLRHPRGPINAYPGGILSPPVQAVQPSRGISRVNADSDSWQRGSGLQRGLIPSPQAPSQIMHKAEKKYEVGKVSDEEQAKQRTLKGILNKLTPQNFERLFQQAKEVNIDNATTLTGVISQIFDKALMEPTFCEMYANFCFHLASALPDFSEDNEKITFKRLLLNKCQEEFERGEREQDEASRNIEGETKESAEEREEKRVKARRRMLGNIRLIGELYKKKMLTERIMHECIKKLLGQYQNPDEEDIESLCKLMSTIGEIIDHDKAKDHMDAYFEMMAKLSTNQKLSSRVRFMLKDSIDLRRNKWQQRRKVEGPKKIEEVHRDAAQERHAQTSRLSRGSGMGPGRRGGQPPPMDYGLRGSNPNLMSSPGPQSAGIRGFPQRSGFSATQDVRMDERHPYEARTLSVPLPQRPSGDETITLGPQGGLARGMANRGQPLGPTATSADVDSSRRLTSSSSNGHGGSSSVGGRGLKGVEGAASARPSAAGESAPESRQLSEADLRDKSILAIKEYYSAKDEKELALCVQELGSPSSYPTVISLWITDSFERKDGDRDSLSKLLVQLTKPLHGLLSPTQLSEGFVAVLDNLEETVTDAPKAGEFFGRMIARAVMEGVVSLGEVGQLIERAGEEPGRLVEAGLAADLLAAALETMRAEKGENYLRETCSSSGIRLESFQTGRSKKLQPFLQI